jgi:hypothetical protein
MQPRVVAAAVALLAGGAIRLAVGYGGRQAGLFLIGAACGVVLYHAAFGFTAAFASFAAGGGGRGLRAQMLMLAVATVLFAPVLAAGDVFGVPVSGSVAPVGAAVAAGAFMFGAGMQLGGGCGSGCLFHLGAGTTSMTVVLVAFVIGSTVATFHMPFWWNTPSLGSITLADRLGWPVAVAVQLVACTAIAAVTWWNDRRRPVPPAAVAATRGWRRAVQGPWPLALGGVLLAVLNFLTLVVAGYPWSITWPFTLWGGKLLQAAGYDLSAVAYWRTPFARAALDSPVLADVISVMDFGLVLGALLAAGLAGRFAPKRRIPWRRLAAGLAGGLLLGYGARIAYGCNIGAYFSGVASTSAHGWLWLVAALAGTPVGLRLRRVFGVDR